MLVFWTCALLAFHNCLDWFFNGSFCSMCLDTIPRQTMLGRIHFSAQNVWNPAPIQSGFWYMVGMPEIWPGFFASDQTGMGGFGIQFYNIASILTQKIPILTLENTSILLIVSCIDILAVCSFACVLLSKHCYVGMLHIPILRMS